MQWKALSAMGVLLVSMYLPGPSQVLGTDVQPKDPAKPDPAKLMDPARELQGKWIRQMRTANGKVTIFKEHKGTRTLVTAYDDKKNLLYAHTSEFKIGKSGKLHVFTFWNRVITAGRGAGGMDPGVASYVYRIRGDQFIEARGLLKDDPSPPAMVIWHRVQPAMP